MAHTFGRATLGLPLHGIIEAPKISFSAKEIDATEWKGDILAVGVTEKDMAKDENSEFQNPILKKIDAQLDGLLAEASAEQGFTEQVGQSAVLRIPGLGFKRVSLIGLGQSASTACAFQNFGEAVAAVAKSVQASNLAVVLASSEELTAELKLNTASAIASGTMLGLHEDNRYNTESKKPALESVDILGLGAGPELEKKLKYAEDVVSGVIFGKELVNSPANVLTPVALAEEALKIAATCSDVLTATILNAEQCRELKMGSYRGVAAASANPPHVIHLRYKPQSGPVNMKLALVGKGPTFDSCDDNIKTGPGCSIEPMKFDMGASAATFGAAKAIGQIKPPGVEVHFIVGAYENMISGTGITGMRPRDNEVNNTDAEGRLKLAALLIHSCNQDVDDKKTLAALTGAFDTALGPSNAGAFTHSDDLAKEVYAAAEASGEKLCRMPLEGSYWDMMKSGVADVVKTGGQPEESYWDTMKSEVADVVKTGGQLGPLYWDTMSSELEDVVKTGGQPEEITMNSGVADVVKTGAQYGDSMADALFLKQFVDEKVQWVHIDATGPVLDDKSLATGYGVSTIVDWVLRNSS